MPSCGPGCAFTILINDAIIMIIKNTANVNAHVALIAQRYSTLTKKPIIPVKRNPVPSGAALNTIVPLENIVYKNLLV